MNESARAETEQKWKDNNISAKSLVGLEVDVRNTETHSADWLVNTGQNTPDGQGFVQG